MERGREGERDDREENPFSKRSPMSVPPLQALNTRDAVSGTFTLWDSSCRPCQTRVPVEALERAQVALFPTIWTKEAMRLCRSASSCRGNSALGMVTWGLPSNHGRCYFPRLTFLLMNRCRIHGHQTNSFFLVITVMTVFLFCN